MVIKTAAALAAFSLTLLSGCPQPIDETLLRVVNDTVPPSLTITSPANNSEYRSTVTVSGTVRDSSFQTGDLKGTIRKLQFEIPDASTLNHTVTFADDGAFSVSPDDGSFHYTPATGAFSIVLVTQELIRDKVLIVIATDARGNATESRLSLLESNGIVVVPDNSVPSAYNIGDTIDLSGVVNNSTSDTASSSELKTLTWAVETKNWGSTLDLTPGAQYEYPVGSGTMHDYLVGSIYQTTNAEVPPFNYFFTFDPATRRFATRFYVLGGAPNPINITITAEDFNGIVTQKRISLALDVQSADIYIDTPNPAATNYYSPVVKPSIPFHGVIAYSDLTKVSPISVLVESSSPSESFDTQNNPGYFAFNTTTGDLDFTVATTNHSGDIRVTTTATVDQPGGPVQSFFPVTLKADAAAPQFSAATLVSNNTNSAFARTGDRVTLQFTVADALSGIDTGAGAPTATIAGHPVSLILVSETVDPNDASHVLSRSYTATYDLAAGDPEDQAVPILITAHDEVQNIATSTSVAAPVTYYESLPALTNIAMTSNNATNPAYAKVGNTVTLDFTVANARTLRGTPTVTIAGVSRTASWTGSVWRATHTFSSAYADGTVPFTVAVTDAAGNTSETYSQSSPGVTTVTYDDTKPTGYAIATDLAPFISAAEQGSFHFAFADAETGTTYAYTVSNSANANTLTGSGTVSSATQIVGGIDLSGMGTLPDGTVITVSAVLTDRAGNTGSPATTTATMDTTPPKATGISTSTVNGWYREGTSITIDVTFDQAVTVTGSPVLTLNSGTNADGAVTQTSNTVRFTYTVAAGDSASALDASTITPAAGIEDAAGNAMSPNSVPSLVPAHAIRIDTTAPTVSITPKLTNNNRPGLSGAVTDADTGAAVTVTVNGSTYPAVNAGDGSWSLASGVVTALPDGTYDVVVAATDAAGNVGTDATSAELRVDTSPPTVSAIAASPTSGDYAESATITINVTFSEDVSMTGSPRLVMSTGNYASYTSKPAGNVLRFTYTVVAGDNDNDLTVSSVDLNGGTISDAAANSANLASIPSMAASNAVVVDTTPPAAFTVGSVAPTGGNVVAIDATTDYWNRTNTAIEVGVPIDAGDASLIGGTVRIRANKNNGSYSDVGTAQTISAAGTLTVSLDATALDTALNPANGDTIHFRARITDRAGNSLIGSGSAETLDYEWARPASFTTGSVTPTGGTVVSGFWNSTNSGVDVDVPIADDASLLTGTLQLVASINGGSQQDLGSAVSIPAKHTTQTVSVTEAELESLTGFADGTVITVLAILRYADGNERLGTASSTTLSVDQTPPAVSGTAAPQYSAGNVQIAITFNEPMDAAATVTVDVVQQAGPTFSATFASWTNGSQTWNGTLSASGSIIPISYSYSISGGRDGAGNTMTPASGYPFVIMYQLASIVGSAGGGETAGRSGGGQAGPGYGGATASYPVPSLPALVTSPGSANRPRRAPDSGIGPESYIPLQWMSDTMIAGPAGGPTVALPANTLSAAKAQAISSPPFITFVATPRGRSSTMANAIDGPGGAEKRDGEPVVSAGATHRATESRNAGGVGVAVRMGSPAPGDTRPSAEGGSIDEAPATAANGAVALLVMEVALALGMALAALVLAATARRG